MVDGRTGGQADGRTGERVITLESDRMTVYNPSEPAALSDQWTCNQDFIGMRSDDSLSNAN